MKGYYFRKYESRAFWLAARLNDFALASSFSSSRPSIFRLLFMNFVLFIIVSCLRCALSQSTVGERESGVWWGEKKICAEFSIPSGGVRHKLVIAWGAKTSGNRGFLKFIAPENLFVCTHGENYKLKRDVRCPDFDTKNAALNYDRNFNANRSRSLRNQVQPLRESKVERKGNSERAAKNNFLFHIMIEKKKII